MKTLTVLRHGKSSWNNPELNDFDRILLPKGEKRTLRIAQWLADHDRIPDLIISSPATRAMLTAEIVANELDIPMKTHNSLYPGHSEIFMEVASGQEDSVNSLMIVGHNPGITMFANDYLAAGIDWLPTSGLAGASFDIKTWSELPAAFVLDNFVIIPKLLK